VFKVLYIRLPDKLVIKIDRYAKGEQRTRASAIHRLLETHPMISKGKRRKLMLIKMDLQQLLAFCYRNWLIGEDYKRLTGMYPWVVLPPSKLPWRKHES